MPFKLSIVKENEPDWHRDITYDKDEITIGRDIKSDLQLEGTKSVVSRRHTQIKVEGGSYKVVDLNSRNFTYLNSQKLTPGVEYALNEGDTLKICDFELRFNAVEHVATRYAEQTILARPNPFLQDAVQLSILIKQIGAKFDQEAGDRKEESLQDSFRDLLGPLGSHKAMEIMVSCLGGVRSYTAPATDQVEAAPPAPASHQEKSLLDQFLGFFVKMIQARRQFRMEFIGETMIKSSKSFSIHNCTEEELKQHLFDPQLPAPERAKRFAQLEYLANELMLHQVSLLDGYKASVRAGTDQFLERLNPQSIQKRVTGKKDQKKSVKTFLGKLPVFGSIFFQKQYQEAFQELAREDQSIIEKKYFRPGYVKRYNARMDSASSQGRGAAQDRHQSDGEKKDHDARNDT
jgi:pSer/pThr/pTyr-binding forkhead associated (FHA) protein